MNKQKSKLQCPAIKPVVILKKKQSFKNEQKSAALTSVFGLNTTKASRYRCIIPYSAIFCFSSISQSLKHEQEKSFEGMEILQSLSKSLTQVTQIKL